MAIVSVSGDAGCRAEDLARSLARRQGWELVTSQTLLKMATSEFGAKEIPARAWPYLAAAILVRIAVRSHLVFCLPGGQSLLHSLSGVFRAHVYGSRSYRIGAAMADLGMDRVAAQVWLAERESEDALLIRERFGKSSPRPHRADLTLNGSMFSPEQQVAVLEAALQVRGLLPGDFLSDADEAQILFQLRLRLARFGLVPQGSAPGTATEFGHPSEAIFAKLLDFYRIAWEYEPRSFPLQWDPDGHVSEAFAPDFYLPEFDLYVELTTMKQALVTRKNRKIKRLRTIYPHINIQVFYQKDIQDLIMKYGFARQGEEG
jgi:hypothetical protein